MTRSTPAVAAALLGFAALPFGLAAPAPVDFESQVAPVLARKCLACHTANIAKGGVILSERSPAADLLVPGNALASDLYLVATPEEPGGKPYMPEKGDPLTEDEAALLRRWIDEGASWPEGLVLQEASKADASWWAYQPLGDPALDSIDAFVDAKLAEHDLARNPTAGRRELIRRATYDLTGLPPTPEEVDAFVNDPDPKSYEKLIDRLLASPHYGERWGRHWLDVIRFGESNGYERNFLINDLWPFRDYVIRSVNEDKPFDRFIQEHLAGDVIDAGDPEAEVGSAFLVAGPYDDVGNQDPVQQAQIRANTLDEIINATGEAFLGMTLGCAKCHDHKFDPIRQADYYALYATFAGIRHASVPWASAEEKKARAANLKPLEDRKSGFEKSLASLDDAILERGRRNLDQHRAKWPRPPADRTGTIETFAPVTAKFVRLVCEAQDINPAAKTFNIDEFEVWSAGPNPVNVALSANGGKASGEARRIEDFPGAYGPQHAIDGKTGARFLSTGDSLTIELARPTGIDRVVFSSAKGEEEPAHPKFAFVAEYRVEASADGETWTAVAHGRDRHPHGEIRQAQGAARNAVRRLSHLEHRLLALEETPEERQQRAATARELAAVNAEIAKIPPLPTLWMGRRVAEDAKGPFHLFIGGNPQRPGDVVVPASLSTLAAVVPPYQLPDSAPEAERRRRLAGWITHPDNPLPARVLANRLWHYHFGTGIVDTPNDFGYMGGRPTHPELLDFLARKLKENGWHLKPLHRLIMLSETYRQSSVRRDAAAQKDGDSRLLWRFPPRRLSAEEIRDTMLAVSGKLDTRMGGPGFQLYKFMQDNVSTYEPLDEHGPETYRRAVYHQNARASVVDLMTDYDQPDCTLPAPKRAQTTTPLQALTMLNHDFTLDMAEALASRVGDAAPAGQVNRLFRLAYQREPSADETARVTATIGSAGLRAVCRAVLNSSELIYLD
jgi:mono/diheme cytochrome c family protein